MQRRVFLTTTCRYALFGALAAISALSLKKAVRHSETDCAPGSFCRNCSLLADCNLVSAKNAGTTVTGESNT